MDKVISHTSSDFRKIWWYLFYTFTIAWGAEFLLIPAYYFKLLSGGLGQFLHFAVIGFGAGMAPAYAAFITAKKYQAITVPEFCKQIFFTRDFRQTVLFTAAFSIIQFIVCRMQETYLGNPWYLFILFIPLMIFGGGLEEIGWRGLLQPLLEKKLPFFIAAIIESFIWSIWHLPLWLVQNTTQASMDFTAFTLYCITLGCTLAAVHRLTKSIWASVLIHAWGNTVLGGMYTISTLIKFPSKKTIAIYTIQLILIAVIIRIFDSKDKQRTSSINE